MPPPRRRFPSALPLLGPLRSELLTGSSPSPRASGTAPSSGPLELRLGSTALLFQLLRRLWRVRTARVHRTYMTPAHGSGSAPRNCSDRRLFEEDVQLHRIRPVQVRAAAGDQVTSSESVCIQFFLRAEQTHQPSFNPAAAAFSLYNPLSLSLSLSLFAFVCHLLHLCPESRPVTVDIRFPRS